MPAGYDVLAIEVDPGRGMHGMFPGAGDQGADDGIGMRVMETSGMFPGAPAPVE